MIRVVFSLGLLGWVAGSSAQSAATGQATGGKAAPAAAAQAEAGKAAAPATAAQAASASAPVATTPTVSSAGHSTIPSSSSNNSSVDSSPLSSNESSVMHQFVYVTSRECPFTAATKDSEAQGLLNGVRQALIFAKDTQCKEVNSASSALETAIDAYQKKANAGNDSMSMPNMVSGAIAVPVTCANYKQVFSSEFYDNLNRIQQGLSTTASDYEACRRPGAEKCALNVLALKMQAEATGCDQANKDDNKQSQDDGTLELARELSHDLNNLLSASQNCKELQPKSLVNILKASVQASGFLSSLNPVIGLGAGAAADLIGSLIENLTSRPDPQKFIEEMNRDDAMDNMACLMYDLQDRLFCKRKPSATPKAPDAPDHPVDSGAETQLEKLGVKVKSVGDAKFKKDRAAALDALRAAMQDNFSATGVWSSDDKGTPVPLEDYLQWTILPELEDKAKSSEKASLAAAQLKTFLAAFDDYIKGVANGADELQKIIRDIEKHSSADLSDGAMTNPVEIPYIIKTFMDARVQSSAGLAKIAAADDAYRAQQRAYNVLLANANANDRADDSRAKLQKSFTMMVDIFQKDFQKRLASEKASFDKRARGPAKNLQMPDSSGNDFDANVLPLLKECTLNAAVFNFKDVTPPDIAEANLLSSNKGAAADFRKACSVFSCNGKNDAFLPMLDSAAQDRGDAAEQKKKICSSALGYDQFVNKLRNAYKVKDAGNWCN